MSMSGTVFLLDDEPGMLKALSRFLTAEGFTVKSFSSAADFLAGYAPGENGCLVLDVYMPDLDGLELQQHLLARPPVLPIVFLTGHGDIPMSVRAIKSGAVDFLTKPVKDEVLLAAVRAALAIAESRDSEARTTAQLRERYQNLTPREREVMGLVITGMLNKQIAAELGTGLQTIKVHRGRAMQKMGLESVADLVRAAERLGITVS